MKTKKQREEFEAVTRPVIEWLCANSNPHATVMIDQASAELLEGELAYTTGDQSRDLEDPK